LYSAQAKVTDENADYLLKLSEVFSVPSLQEFLGNYFIKKLEEKKDAKTALKYLQLGDRNNLPELKRKCISVLRKEKQILIHTTAWNEILGKNPALLLEVFTDEPVQTVQI
jgi:hypothetical protein